jgi:NitT/TauT family transport system permease protein
LWRVVDSSFQRRCLGAEVRAIVAGLMTAKRSAAVPSGHAPSKPGRWLGERVSNLAAPVLATVAVIAVWAAVVKIFDIPDYLLPAPQAVAARIVKEWPLLAKNGAYTLMSVLTGFVAGVAIGVPLAFGIVLSRSMERIAMPFLVMSQTIPKVAIAPILVVWLGFGILPKIAIVFLISFFPIVVSTVVGLKSVETDMIDLVRSMGARTAKIMLRVRGPSALPQMFAGFKIAVCLAVVGAIVGEFVGSDRGLGYLLLTSTGTLDGTLVWAALFVLIAMGIALFAIVSKLERLAIPWHVSVRAEDTAAYQS